MKLTRTYVGERAEIVKEERVLIAVGDLEIGVFVVGNVFVAYENRCPHQGGPVCRGKVLARLLDGTYEEQSALVEDTADLSCPWHGWEYDLVTGRHIGTDRVALRSFPVVVEEEHVFVELGQ